MPVVLPFSVRERGPACSLDCVCECDFVVGLVGAEEKTTMASLATDANFGLGSLDTVLLSEICLFLPVVRSGLHFGHTSKQLNVIVNGSFPMFCKRDFGITVGKGWKGVCFPTFKTAVMCRDGEKEQGKMEVHPVGRTTSHKVLYRQFYKLHLLKFIAAGKLVPEG